MKCHLCNEDKELLRSHIIPELFYKPVYDGLHRLNVVSTIPGYKSKPQQKGYRERLLCRDCEQFLSGLEDYAKRVFYGGVKIETIDITNGIKVTGIDYQKFKLFQLSVLWRASISKQLFFSGVNLGPHEETIRSMLKARTPGKAHDFGCMMIALTWEDNRPFDQMILQPDSLYIDGHRCFRFLFGGCLWLFAVSSHSYNFKYKNLFLSEGGEVTIPIGQAQYADLITGFAEDFRETQN